VVEVRIRAITKLTTNGSCKTQSKRAEFQDEDKIKPEYAERELQSPISAERTKDGLPGCTLKLFFVVLDSKVTGRGEGREGRAAGKSKKKQGLDTNDIAHGPRVDSIEPGLSARTLH
jgi:hypothetical protein